MKYYINSIFFKYLGALLAFLFTVQITRFLSLENVGQISVMLAASSIFQISFIFGRQNIVLREYPRLDYEQRSNHIAVIQTRINKVFIFTLLLLPSLLFIVDVSTFIIISLACVLGFILAKNSIFASALKSQGQAVSAIFLESSLRWVLSVSVIQFWIVFSFSHLFIIALVASILSSFIAYTVLKSMLPKGLGYHLAGSFTSQSEANDKAIGIAALLQAINENIPVLVALFLFDEAIAALIRVSFVIASLVSVTPNTVNQLVARNISIATAKGSHANDTRDLIALVASIFLSVTVFVISVYYLKEIIVLAFGDKYTGAVTYAIIFMIAQLVSVFFGPVAQHLDMIKRSEYLARLVLVAILIQVSTVLAIEYFSLDAGFICIGYLLSIIFWKSASFVYLRAYTDYRVPIVEIFKK